MNEGIFHWLEIPSEVQAVRYRLVHALYLHKVRVNVYRLIRRAGDARVDAIRIKGRDARIRLLEHDIARCLILDFDHC